MAACTAANERRKRKILIFTFDIETTGCDVNLHSMIAAGYCAGTLDDQIVAKGRICFQMRPGTVMEDRCYNEYWSKDPRQLQQLTEFTKEGQPPDIAIAKFIDVLDKLETSWNVHCISDNPGFDAMFLNYYLSKYLNRRPLDYVHGLEDYRGGVETPLDFAHRFKCKKNRSYGYYFDCKAANHLIAKIEVPHDHYPENDAHNMYKKTLVYCRDFQR